MWQVSGVHDSVHKTKVLVLTELLSSCVGYIVCGENVGRTHEWITNYLYHFGLMTDKASS